MLRKGNKGSTLNDTLIPGQNCRHSIDIFIFPYCFLSRYQANVSADFGEPKHRNSWPLSPNEPLKEYRLKIVIYRVTSSPY